MLRVTWLCWLASLLGWFALPAFGMYLADGSEVTFITEWSVAEHNAPICIALLLAALAPTLVHQCDPRRRTPTFRCERAACRLTDYRSPPALSTSVDARAFSANVQAFVGRLAIAMSLSAVAAFFLWEPIFWIQEPSCVRIPHTFCLAEYFAYLVALLGVVLVHAPTRRRVFGSPPPGVVAGWGWVRAGAGALSARASSRKRSGQFTSP